MRGVVQLVLPYTNSSRAEKPFLILVEKFICQIKSKKKRAMAAPLCDVAEFKAIAEHVKATKGLHMRDLFEKNADRFNDFRYYFNAGYFLCYLRLLIYLH